MVQTSARNTKDFPQFTTFRDQTLQYYSQDVLSSFSDTRVAHSKCLIDVVLKFRMRQLDMSGYYLRYLSNPNS